MKYAYFSISELFVNEYLLRSRRISGIECMYIALGYLRRESGALYTGIQRIHDYRDRLFLMRNMLVQQGSVEEADCSVIY